MVPFDDPTLLFNNAGMNQVPELEPEPHSQVGKDVYHHTLCESGSCSALDATQGQMDGLFSQLPYKCYLECGRLTSDLPLGYLQGGAVRIDW